MKGGCQRMRKDGKSVKRDGVRLRRCAQSKEEECVCVKS